MGWPRAPSRVGLFLLLSKTDRQMGSQTDRTRGGTDQQEALGEAGCQEQEPPWAVAQLPGCASDNG